MGEPRTKAGRALLAILVRQSPDFESVDHRAAHNEADWLP